MTCENQVGVKNILMTFLDCDTGAIYGFIQISGDVYKDPRTVGKATEIGGLVAFVIFIATCVFSILLLLRIL